jgi:hypothetical protein
MYLRNWADSEGRVWVYDLLVPHQNIRLWRKSPTSGVAYHSDLYTHSSPEGETDEFEKWFADEVESPAQSAIRKVVADEPLSKDELRCLVRFAVAQDLRTPAHYKEMMGRLRRLVPRMIDGILQETAQKLKHNRGLDIGPGTQREPDVDLIPMRMDARRTESGQGELSARVVIGRGMWLFKIRHVLSGLADMFVEHDWTILTPPTRLQWLTSDDPVVLLNYYGSGSYDFLGGWGNPGTDIFLPLSPRHLLFTEVGRSTSLASVVPTPTARQFRRFFVEHAHRLVIASSRDDEVPNMRPRTVDAVKYTQERDEWQEWHCQQTSAESNLRKQ